MSTSNSMEYNQLITCLCTSINFRVYRVDTDLHAFSFYLAVKIVLVRCLEQCYVFNSRLMLIQF